MIKDYFLKQIRTFVNKVKSFFNPSNLKKHLIGLIVATSLLIIDI